MVTALIVGFQNTLAELNPRQKEERGAAMVEYGLLLALVGLVSIVILMAFAGEIVELFTDGEQNLDTRAVPAVP